MRDEVGTASDSNSVLFSISASDRHLGSSHELRHSIGLKRDYFFTLRQGLCEN